MPDGGNAARPCRSNYILRVSGRGSAERGFLRTELVGLTDQALASGTNFLTLILVARTVTPVQFGYFALVFTLIQSLGTVQTALITRPHNVLGSARTGDDYRRYTGTLAAAQGAFAVVLAALLLIAAVGAHAAGNSAAPILLAASPGLLAWQLQEFGRRVLYTEGRIGSALLNDALSYGGQIVALSVLWQTGSLTGPSALYIVAVTSAAGAVLAAFQVRRSITRGFERAPLSLTWRFGRWLGAGEVAYWIASQSFLYLAGAVVGAAASGALKASQTLLGPLSVFLAFFSTSLPIRFARADAAGGTELHDEVKRAWAIMLPIGAAYCLLTALFARSLLHLVYGSGYARYAGTVRLIALYYLVLTAANVVVGCLSGVQRTKQVFRANACAAIFSVAGGWLLVRGFGVNGAALGLIGGVVVTLAVCAPAYRAVVDERATPTATVS